jgi:ankyrin repeat protein
MAIADQREELKSKMADDWGFEQGFEKTRLHFAAGDGDLEAVLKFVSEGRDPNDFDEIGNTPLHYAAQNEHFEVVKALIAHGARVNACSEAHAGNTALGHVAQTCSLAMAQLLIDAGADPTIPGGMQLNAIHRAERRKRGEGPAVYDLLCRVAGR